MSKLSKKLKKQGISKNNPDSAFDPKALKQGTKIELEHVDDEEAAKEIAKDHLKEDPEYYNKLAEMEKSKKEEKRVADLEKKVRDWFLEHPNPEDYEVHKFAEELGVNKHSLEEVIYKLTTQHAKMIEKSRKLVFRKSKSLADYDRYAPDKRSLRILRKAAPRSTEEMIDAEPSFLDEAAIDVIRKGKVPETYSRSLHDFVQGGYNET